MTVSGVDWGRFTACGSPEAEARIADMVTRVAETLAGALRRRTYRAVVMTGSYGRGEGGVLVEDGYERPHNNFDLLIISRGGVGPSELKRRADEALGPLIEEFGIGIDIGCVSERQISRAPCLVMWYDTRFGHKTLLGDDQFVPSLRHFTREDIADWDVRNLLANRGTLLVINQLLLQRAKIDGHEQRLVIRHAMKGIIGYGDALLFFLGDYDWSYREKQRRMRQAERVSSNFRALYDEAIEFRFRPRYADYLTRDLAAWNSRLLSELREVHLRCEALRLGIPELRWDDYGRRGFSRALVERGVRPRELARKARNALHRRCPGRPGGGRARLGLLAAGWRERLSLLFPAVAYDLDAPAYRSLAQVVLGVQDPHPDRLRAAYLRVWSDHVDPNFPAGLRDLCVSLAG